MTDVSNRLFDEVLADARTKADRARKRGQREAQSAAQKIDEQIDSVCQQVLAEGRKQAEARRREIMATVEIEAQRHRLARLEESLTAVRDRALKLILAIPTEKQSRSREGLALEALHMAPPADLELMLPDGVHQQQAPALAETLQRAALEQPDNKSQITASAKPAGGIETGLVLRSTDGRFMIDQSFRQRLRRLWPQLRLEVARTLFDSM